MPTQKPANAPTLFDPAKIGTVQRDITYCTAGDVALKMDVLVPLGQGEELYGRLEAVGAPVQLVVVKNAGHVFVPVGGKPIQPTREQITQMIADFFDQVLR